jgi:TonB family protein
VDRVRTDRTGDSGPTTSAPTPTIVTMGGHPSTVCLTCIADPTRNNPEEGPPSPYVGNKNLPTNLIGGNDHGPGIKPGGPKRIVSQLTEAQLLNRVEPVYPHIAVLTGVQGQVKLHAIIARDGSIQSLNVISGHPLLVRAAAEAVGQWRYRPYILNGEAVEVETFITVNFRKDAH